MGIYGKKMDLAKMNRRKFTKFLGSIGMSIAGIQHATRESVEHKTDDMSKEIPG